MAIGLPQKNKAGKVRRPTALQKRRARRTLRLRGLTYLGASRKLPGKLWDSLYRRVPQAPDPSWKVPTVPDLVPIPMPARKPLQLTAGPSPKGSTPMSVSDAINDAFAKISGFEPEAASEVEQLIIEQPEMFSDIAKHYETLADRMSSDMPFDPSVSDAMRDLAAGISALNGLASNVHTVMRSVHEADFARTENPRQREDMWNPDKQ